jgi:hypothetical protein
MQSAKGKSQSRRQVKGQMAKRKSQSRAERAIIHEARSWPFSFAFCTLRFAL